MKCYLCKTTNNEEKVLTHFQTHSSNKNWYPKLFWCDLDERVVEFEGEAFVSYKTLCYSFIPGVTATTIDKKDSVYEAKKHLEEHLKDLHSMGFVHGDIKRDNIVHESDGRWYFIDYEHCHSLNGPYPCTKYNTTFQSDEEDLGIVLHSMLVDKWKMN